MYNVHKPAYLGDVIGLGGYHIERSNIITFTISGNKYADEGILDGSLVFCDASVTFNNGDLIAILNKDLGCRQLSYNVSENDDYLGKVIMSVRSFE